MNIELILVLARGQFLTLRCRQCSRRVTWEEQDILDRFSPALRLMLRDVQAKTKCGVCGGSTPEVHLRGNGLSRTDEQRAAFNRRAYQLLERQGIDPSSLGLPVHLDEEQGHWISLRY